MEYRILGKTGLSVSRIGLGGIPIQRTEVGSVFQLLDRLEALGVNFIDTARGYSVSETYLGAALSGRRDRFILASKSPERSYEGMWADIERSLCELQTNHIDLYQIHNASVADFDRIHAPDGAVAAMLEAKACGKIGHLGITVHTADAFEKALELPWVETVMFPYNIVETQGEALIERCSALNIGFIAMKPLAGGAIDDPKLALKFILNNENVTLAIPGMYTVEEAEQNAVVQIGAYTDEEAAELDRIRSLLNGTFCRRCGYCLPCTAGIQIPVMFTFQGYLNRYGLKDWAKPRYEAMAHKPEDCTGCGLCESRCPYQLPIRSMLKQVRKDFEG